MYSCPPNYIIHLSLLETLRPLRPLRFNHSQTTVNDIITK